MTKSRMQGWSSGIQGSSSRMQGSSSRVEGSSSRVQGSSSEIKGSDSRERGLTCVARSRGVGSNKGRCRCWDHTVASSQSCTFKLGRGKGRRYVCINMFRSIEMCQDVWWMN